MHFLDGRRLHLRARAENKSRRVSQFALECDDRRGEGLRRRTNITQIGLRCHNYLEYESAIAAFLGILRRAVSPSLQFCRTRNEFAVPENVRYERDEIAEGRTSIEVTSLFELQLRRLSLVTDFCFFIWSPVPWSVVRRD